MPEDITFFDIDPDKLTPEKRERLISILKAQFEKDFPENKKEENQWQK